MTVYTISKLAKDAGVSTHIVRDYQMRGILKPCNCMDCGYGIYDKSALERLKFIRAGKEAGVSLNDLTKLCKAMDVSDNHSIMETKQLIQRFLTSKRQHLETFTNTLRSFANE